VTSLFPENDIKLEDLFLEIKYDGPFNGITIFADSSLYFLSIRLDLIISFALSGMGKSLIC
jgi:hypothetical protein